MIQTSFPFVGARLDSRNFWAAAAVVVTVVGLSGCLNSERESIGNAQSCMDSARTAADADRCFNMVASMDTAQANLIKCSARYVQQGFTGNRFAQAFEGLQGTGGSAGADAMATTVSFMSFSTSTLAQEVFGYCQKSGLKSLERLAVMSQVATSMMSIGQIINNPNCPAPGQVPTGSTNLANCLSAIQTNITNNGGTSGNPIFNDTQTLGNTAIVAQQAYCSEGSAFRDSEICRNLNQAVQPGRSAQQIAEQLLAQIRQN